MRVKVQDIKQGLHPNERIVGLATEAGAERLVVHMRSLQNDTLNVGYPIAERDDQYLVELPRETLSGAWRVWVSKNIVMESSAA